MGSPNAFGSIHRQDFSLDESYILPFMHGPAIYFSRVLPLGVGREYLSS